MNDERPILKGLLTHYQFSMNYCTVTTRREKTWCLVVTLACCSLFGIAFTLMVIYARQALLRSASTNVTKALLWTCEPTQPLPVLATPAYDTNRFFVEKHKDRAVTTQTFYNTQKSSLIERTNEPNSKENDHTNWRLRLRERGMLKFFDRLTWSLLKSCEIITLLYVQVPKCLYHWRTFVLPTALSKPNRYR